MTISRDGIEGGVNGGLVMLLPRLLIGGGIVFLWLFAPGLSFADNCWSLSDCFGGADAAAEAMAALAILSALMNFIPYLGQAKGLVEAITGRDLLTDQKLSGWERFLGILPLAGGAVKGVGLGGRIANAIGRGARVVGGEARAVRAGRAARSLARGGVYRALSRPPKPTTPIIHYPGSRLPTAPTRPPIQPPRTPIREPRAPTVGPPRGRDIPTPPPPLGKAIIFGDEKKMTDLAKNIKPKSGYFDVFTHGNRNGLAFKSGTDWVNLSVDDVIRAMRANGYKGGPVRLLACSTGGGVEAGRFVPGGVAKELSKKLGVPVIAPNEAIWFTGAGNVRIGNDVGIPRAVKYISDKEPWEWAGTRSSTGYWTGYGFSK